MLGAFFETFLITLGIFVLLEMVLRLVGYGKQPKPVIEHQEILDQLEDAIILCKVEQVKNIFYLYNAQDDSFVGQARDVNEFTSLSERLQKHLMIVDGEETVVDQLKRMVNETSPSQ